MLVSDKLKKELDNFLLGLTISIFLLTGKLYLFQKRYQTYATSYP